MLACGSLYFGLVITDKALNLSQILHILIGRSIDNTHYELSPYFWTMHTTFIPTLLYLSLILFCWIGKAMLIPVRWFFGKGQEHKNPLKLAAALCGLFVAIFTVLAFVASAAQERAEKKNQTQSPIVLQSQERIEP
jgi:hypothetical protein